MGRGKLDDETKSCWGPGGGRRHVGLLGLVLFVGAVVLAGVAVGLQNWAYQETNVWEKTIGLFERCTDFKGGKTECSSVTASNCKASQKEGDPDDCDEMVSFLKGVAAMMIIGAVLSLAAAVLCAPVIQMHAVSCIVGIVSGVTFLISIAMFAAMDRKFSGFFQKDACFSTSFGCAIAALFLAWCASLVAGIATREEDEDDDEY